MNCKALAVRKSGRTLKTLLTVIVVFASMITGMAQVPSYVPTNGLVGWWPFNGNANDESGNGNNGAVNGATLTSDRNGFANTAYSFDGVNDFIEILNSASLESNNISIGFWVKSSSNLFQQIIYKVTPNTAANESYSIPLNLTQAGKINFDLKNNNCSPGQGWNLFSTNVTTSNWTYIVLTHDGVNSKIYQNGQLISNNLANFNANNCQGGNLLIGATWQYSNCFNGQLDDIGIWNRALTQQEITNLYTASTPPPCNPLAANLMNGLVGYWPFCGNANDESGNGNNGTVNGATLTSDRFGNANAAYSFDGVNDFIEVVGVNYGTGNQHTISAWVNLVASYPGGYPQHYIIDNGTTLGGVYLNTDVDEIQFGCNSIGNSVSLGTWHNYVGVVNGNSFKVYLDGVYLGANTSCNVQFLNSIALNIGRSNVNTEFANGKLDDICIWNRALTQNEITQLYTGSPCINYQVITVTDTLIINANLTGINPVTFQNAIKVYPNPSSTQITIDFGSNYATMTGYTMRIQNAVGQTVYTTGVTQQQFTSNLSTWTGNGIYFVYLIDAQGNTVDVKKIILQ